MHNSDTVSQTIASTLKCSILVTKLILVSVGLVVTSPAQAQRLLYPGVVANSQILIDAGNGRVLTVDAKGAFVEVDLSSGRLFPSKRSVHGLAPNEQYEVVAPVRRANGAIDERILGIGKSWLMHRNYELVQLLPGNIYVPVEDAGDAVVVKESGKERLGSMVSNLWYFSDSVVHVGTFDSSEIAIDLNLGQSRRQSYLLPALTAGCGVLPLKRMISATMNDVEVVVDGTTVHVTHQRDTVLNTAPSGDSCVCCSFAVSAIAVDRQHRVWIELGEVDVTGVHNTRLYRSDDLGRTYRLVEGLHLVGIHGSSETHGTLVWVRGDVSQAAVLYRLEDAVPVKVSTEDNGEEDVVDLLFSHSTTVYVTSKRFVVKREDVSIDVPFTRFLVDGDAAYSACLLGDSVAVLGLNGVLFRLENKDTQPVVVPVEMNVPVHAARWVNDSVVAYSPGVSTRVYGSRSTSYSISTMLGVARKHQAAFRPLLAASGYYHQLPSGEFMIVQAAGAILCKQEFPWDVRKIPYPEGVVVRGDLAAVVRDTLYSLLLDGVLVRIPMNSIPFSADTLADLLNLLGVEPSKTQRPPPLSTLDVQGNQVFIGFLPLRSQTDYYARFPHLLGLKDGQIYWSSKTPLQAFSGLRSLIDVSTDGMIVDAVSSTLIDSKGSLVFNDVHYVRYNAQDETWHTLGGLSENGYSFRVQVARGSTTSFVALDSTHRLYQMEHLGGSAHRANIPDLQNQALFDMDLHEGNVLLSVEAGLYICPVNAVTSVRLEDQDNINPVSVEPVPASVTAKIVLPYGSVSDTLNCLVVNNLGVVIRTYLLTPHSRAGGGVEALFSLDGIAPGAYFVGANGANGIMAWCKLLVAE